jgi:circadian clock protein KaiC
LTDGIVLQRYVELEGQLRKVLVVAKMRGFDHSKELRLYDIRDGVIEIGDALADHEDILVGRPRKRGSTDSGDSSS